MCALVGDKRALSDFRDQYIKYKLFRYNIMLTKKRNKIKMRAARNNLFVCVCVIRV